MSKAETLLLWIPAVVDVTRFEIALGCSAIGFLKGHPHGNQLQLHTKTIMLTTPFLVKKKKKIFKSYHVSRSKVESWSAVEPVGSEIAPMCSKQGATRGLFTTYSMQHKCKIYSRMVFCSERSVGANFKARKWTRDRQNVTFSVAVMKLKKREEKKSKHESHQK